MEFMKEKRYSGQKIALVWNKPFCCQGTLLASFIIDHYTCIPNNKSHCFQEILLVFSFNQYVPVHSWDNACTQSKYSLAQRFLQILIRVKFTSYPYSCSGMRWDLTLFRASFFWGGCSFSLTAIPPPTLNGIVLPTAKLTWGSLLCHMRIKPAWLQVWTPVDTTWQSTSP